MKKKRRRLGPVFTFLAMFALTQVAADSSGLSAFLILIETKKSPRLLPRVRDAAIREGWKGSEPDPPGRGS